MDWPPQAFSFGAWGAEVRAIRAELQSTENFAPVPPELIERMTRVICCGEMEKALERVS